MPDNGIEVECELAQPDASAKLLIEEGIITTAESPAKIAEERATSRESSLRSIERLERSEAMERMERLEHARYIEQLECSMRPAHGLRTVRSA